MREDTNIKGADTESDFWLIIYSVPGPFPIPPFYIFYLSCGRTKVALGMRKVRCNTYTYAIKHIEKKQQKTTKQIVLVLSQYVGDKVREPCLQEYSS